MSPAPTSVTDAVCPTTGTAASRAAPHATNIPETIETVRRTVFLIPSTLLTENGKGTHDVSPTPRRNNGRIIHLPGAYCTRRRTASRGSPGQEPTRSPSAGESSSTGTKTRRGRPGGGAPPPPLLFLGAGGGRG